MNGVHDLGGMHGFGPVEREEHEPLFHAAWEARVRAMAELMGRHGYYTVDASRHGIELIPPAEYLRASYYERWLGTLEYNLPDQGLLTIEELDTRVAFLRDQPGVQPPPAVRVTPATPARAAPPAAPPAPRFAVGDAVVARNAHPVGHTRLPRYARGKRGTIHRSYGPQTFPDTNAHGLGKQPQPVYNVRFEGRDLWGDSAEPGQVVHLDLWDSYLDPAPA